MHPETRWAGIGAEYPTPDMPLLTTQMILSGDFANNLPVPRTSFDRLTGVEHHICFKVGDDVFRQSIMAEDFLKLPTQCKTLLWIGHTMGTNRYWKDQLADVYRRVNIGLGSNVVEHLEWVGELRVAARRDLITSSEDGKRIIITPKGRIQAQRDVVIKE